MLLVGVVVFVADNEDMNVLEVDDPDVDEVVVGDAVEARNILDDVVDVMKDALVVAGMLDVLDVV